MLLSKHRLNRHMSNMSNAFQGIFRSARNRGDVEYVRYVNRSGENGKGKTGQV